MKGILILAHGSREKSTEGTLYEIVKELRKRINECIIEMAFLQFSETNLNTGLDKLKAKGASEINVIPYFLFEGVHIREDIPKEIEEYLNKNPGMKISMGSTLGYDERLVEILVDRVKETI